MIEVKTSQADRFVTRFYQTYKSAAQEHPTFWVLYNISSLEIPTSEQFFILSHHELAQVQQERNYHGKSSKSWEDTATRFSAGVDNVLLKHVSDYENAWDKITAYCSKEL